MTKIKPVKAWAVVFEGEINSGSIFACFKTAKTFAKDAAILNAAIPFVIPVIIAPCEQPVDGG